MIATTISRLLSVCYKGFIVATKLIVVIVIVIFVIVINIVIWFDGGWSLVLNRLSLLVVFKGWTW